jgi:hypothetical protein
MIRLALTLCFLVWPSPEPPPGSICLIAWTHPQSSMLGAMCPIRNWLPRSKPVESVETSASAVEWGSHNRRRLSPVGSGEKPIINV